LESQNTELTKMVQDLEEKEREWSSAKWVMSSLL
jgi:hypothetical protein